MNIDVSVQPLVRDQYDIIGKLGRGTYGVVYKATKKECHEKENPCVAVKIMYPQKENKIDCLTTISQLREVKLIKELCHENIVEPMDFMYNYPKKEFAIVYEYADYDLHDFIDIYRHKGQYIPMDIIRPIMWQLLSAASYLHRNWIMHRDIKPTNILIFDNETSSGRIKLTDFGLARSFQEPVLAFNELERVVVTLWYRAPELLLGCKTYGPAVDIWAIGCVFAKMINLKDLFCGTDIQSKTEKTLFQSSQCERIFSIVGLPSIYDWPEIRTFEHYSKVSRWGFDKHMTSTSSLQKSLHLPEGERNILISSEASDLISKLLTLNPDRRITASEALQHPFFTNHPECMTLNAFPPKSERAFVIPEKRVDCSTAALAAITSNINTNTNTNTAATTTTTPSNPHPNANANANPNPSTPLHTPSPNAEKHTPIEEKQPENIVTPQ